MSQTNSKEDEIANIDLCKNLLDRMSQLCMSHNYSDVVFIVEGEKLSAHKCILAAANKYFEILLYGDLSESNQKEIELKVPLEAFKVLLRFIYSGRVCLKDIEEETVLDTLVLANTYNFMDLEVAIVRYLKEVVTLNNVWAIFKIAWHCELKDLKEFGYNFLDINGSKLLAKESFNHMPAKLLQDVLERDSFLAPEFEIFTALRDWFKHNPDGDVDSVLSHVRFPLMSDNELTKVRKSGIVNVDKLMDALEVRGKSNKLPYRVWPEENMISLKFGPKIIQGTWDTEPSPGGDIYPYDRSLCAFIDSNIKLVAIKATSYEGIVVELGATSIINHIEVNLCGEFTYFLEVSTNQSQWERVVDYSDCCCLCIQVLFFPPKSVKYIKLVGTSDKGLTIEALVATYAEIIRKQINGFIAANIEIWGGNAKPKRALLERNSYSNNNEVTVQLGQPYHVGSLRVFFSNNDSCPYDYCIEVSTNKKDWWRVANKSNENAISWQNITFPPCPVVYIKISFNKICSDRVFKCIHFEQEEETAPDANELKTHTE